MKYLVVAAFVGIVVSLGSALFFMMRNGNNDALKGNRMARALAVRVGLSILLFLCLLAAWQLGYIQPTGLPATRLTHHAHKKRSRDWHSARQAKPQKKRLAALFLLTVGAYIQYTRMYKPSQTTSTKCQYQAAPSKPKCLSAVKWPFCRRSVMNSSINIPMNTWKP